MTAAKRLAEIRKILDRVRATQDRMVEDMPSWHDPGHPVRQLDAKEFDRIYRLSKPASPKGRRKR